MKNISHILALGMMLLAVTSVQAQMTYTATGGNALTPEVLNTVELPNGNVLVTSVSHGFIWTNEEGMIGGNGSLECHSSSTVGPDGEPLDGSGMCVGLDPDGDLWWTWSSGTVEGEWGLTAGTGKYAGINGGGTWKTQIQYADGKVTNEWEGTWTIPAAEMGESEME